MALTDYLTSIANAIRTKKGTTEKINAQNFASEIENLPSGGGEVLEAYDGTVSVVKTPTGPVLPEKKDFADLTWEEIKTVLYMGTVNDLNQFEVNGDVWFEVGDEKPITLSTGEQLTIQIADFNHDVDNNGNTVPATFVTKEVMATNHRMNTTYTNAGGWANSEMYTYLQSDVFNMLPVDLQSVITPVIKKSTEGSQSTNILSSVDRLFLLSQAEVNYNATTAPYNEEGTPYPIFTTSSSSRIKYKVGATSAAYWWLRSPYPSSSSNFHLVNNYGTVATGGADIARGVVPCFAI